MDVGLARRKPVVGAIRRRNRTHVRTHTRGRGMTDDGREGVGRAVSRSVALPPTARRTLYTHQRCLRAELQGLAPPSAVSAARKAGTVSRPTFPPARSVAGPPRVTWEGGGRWRGDSVAPRVYFVVSGRRPAGRVMLLRAADARRYSRREESWRRFCRPATDETTAYPNSVQRQLIILSIRYSFP